MPPTVDRRYRLGLAIGFLVLYGFTAGRTILWSDPAKYILYAMKGALWPPLIHRHTGLLLVLQGLQLVTPRNFWFYHMAAALFGILALDLFYRLLRHLTVRPGLAAATTAMLGISHTFWLYAVQLETYTGLLFGILSGAWFLTRKRPRSVAIGTLYAVGGLWLTLYHYLVLPAWLLMGTVKGWNTFRRQSFGTRIAFAGIALALVIGAFQVPWLRSDILYHLQHYFMPGKLLRQLIKFPLYLAYQFPHPGLLLLLPGLMWLYREHRAWAVGSLLVGAFFLVLALSYFIQRQFAMLLPVYAVVALWMGCGLENLYRSRPQLKTWLRRLMMVTLVAPLLLYGLAPGLVKRTPLHRLLTIRDLPYRDEWRYFLTPWKHNETSAVQYCRSVFRLAPAHARVLADFNPGITLQLWQAWTGSRRDIEVVIKIDDLLRDPRLPPGAAIAAWIESHMKRNGELFLADRYAPYYRVDELSHRFCLEPVGPLLRVTYRCPAPD